MRVRESFFSAAFARAAIQPGSRPAQGQAGQRIWRPTHLLLHRDTTAHEGVMVRPTAGDGESGDADNIAPKSIVSGS